MKLETFLLAREGSSKKGEEMVEEWCFFDDLRCMPCVFTLDVVVE